MFEPRSWSSRRNVFQKQFANAFRHCDQAIIAPVFEPEKVPANVRLDPDLLAAEITKSGTPCRYIAEHEELLQHLVSQVRPGDKLILMSNGSFEGLHEKVLEGLRS